MKIAFGSDHVGYELKPTLIKYVQELGYETYDFGTYSKQRTDYPIYGKKVGEVVARGDYDLGIIICGTGVGISLAANKVPGIRAASVSEPYSAALSRRHNNSNILALGSRVIGSEMAKLIVKSWLESQFEGGRHQRRIDELTAEDEHNETKFDRIVKDNSGQYDD
ncbi:ribose 5-phosphate isomerase B [Bombilactobacillus folatiphilus]|uniref:Ribose 5-phosphate isomerase B n=1 Tax=Bombilactobacillus folatiphilus TaxID=2923362 RepID=A0ABY4PAH9_9LACO|nr:ribose 5-phosphate isomerase B [Bombilactobacillus folatiphilus]UQS82630.1 ribose 5-phosphate isomerase B [Bombilactobacillus folatiphilus]